MIAVAAREIAAIYQDIRALLEQRDRKAREARPVREIDRVWR